jgi:hypothetical protein
LNNVFAVPLAGVLSAPRGPAREQRRVAARGVGEVAHREDHVVERIEHAAQHATARPR